MADDNLEGEGLPLEEDDAAAPSDLADSPALVERRVPAALRKKYEFHSYKNAVVILSETRTEEWHELLDALQKFTITTDIIRAAGGNESDIPKRINKLLRPQGWHETVIRGDLIVRLFWKEQVGVTKGGKAKFEKRETEKVRSGYLDGHKIDYVKNKVAFDLEWNSKDQTFDRDLYAFAAFYQAGAVDAAVLLTRSASLNDVFRHLGIMSKYGASTTWMGKLLYRLNAGRNGGCPVLAIGMKPECIEDWPPKPDGSAGVKVAV